MTYTLTRHRHSGLLRPISPPPHPRGLPSPPGPPSCSLSDGQASAAEPAFPSYTSSTVASPPSHLRKLFLLTPPPAIPCPTPRARAAALDRHAAPPREVGPALFGRGLAPAPAVSLSSSARPYAPTPLSKAASAHLSPPPTTDPKPPLGPSGLGFPVRRRACYQRDFSRSGWRNSRLINNFDIKARHILHTRNLIVIEI